MNACRKFARRRGASDTDQQPAGMPRLDAVKRLRDGCHFAAPDVYEAGCDDDPLGRVEVRLDFIELGPGEPATQRVPKPR